MAVDVMGVKDDQILPFLGEPLGLTKFMADADGKVMVF
jgi:peroxiredoxin family protein